jgi:phosphoenolpyruvate carboxykinase (GTP)
VFLGSIMASETTAAATGKVGALRRDPMAMLPFCGYHMGDYFSHWLKIGEQSRRPENLPRIYYVNWFRKNAEGRYLWPGYGENSRVLKWIFERSDKAAGDASNATKTAIGYLPMPGSIDRAGLPVHDDEMRELLRVDVDGWRTEVPSIREHYAKFGERLPKAMMQELEGLEQRLKSSM